MNLFAVQEISNAHSDSIWVAKFSPCGNYLATGGKDACLKVWKVRDLSDLNESNDENDTEYRRQDDYRQFKRPDLTLFETKPAWEFREHVQDIVDVCWSEPSEDEKDQIHILSCSFDCKVIQWSLQSDSSLPVQIFDHPDVPCQISFAPGIKDVFVSGCFDGIIRLWSLKKKQSMIFAEPTPHSNEKITSLCFSPDSKWLVIGLSTIGMGVVFEHQPY